MKFIIALAVVIGVSSALGIAFLAVLIKCCYVWWKYRRKQQHGLTPHPAYETRSALSAKSQWPGFTYQSCENIQPKDFDSLSSSTTEEPYIIETPSDLGKIQFWYEYNIEEDVLVIGLVQAKGIICQTNVHTALVYPELSLCKDDEVIEERKVESQPMRFEPEWNEEVLFPLKGNHLEKLMFRIQLFEVDSFSKRHMIGQLSLPLDDIELDEPTPKWYDLMGEDKVC